MNKVKTLKIALVWNSNAWKSSFLNTLTWSKRHTSNYHWTTVDIFTAETKVNWINFKITDLPWIYSFDNYTDEEKVTKDSLEKDDYSVLIQIIDTKHKKRSLALTFELMRLNKPLLLIFNRQIKACVHCKLINKIEKEIWIPWIELNVLNLKESKTLFFEKLINIKQKVNHTQKLEEIFKWKEDKKSEFNFIKNRLEKYFPKNLLIENISAKVDSFLLNKFVWIPFFLFLMWVIFQLTFTIWAYPMNFFDSLIVITQWLLSNFLWESLISSLIVDWVIWWVWAVLIFLWPILILFFFLSLVQESWYLARTAYLLENLMAKFWLTWKSFVPLLMWFGCNVPAIMAIRTLWNFREKIITATMIPFMSCGARLPIYTILLAAFVEDKWRWTILFWLYLFWVFISFLSWFILNKFLKWKKKELIIELPEYRIPSIKKSLKMSFHKWMVYIKKAGTIIFPLVLLTWFLFTFPQNWWIEWSYWAKIWHSIQVIFEPLWFDWKISTALIAWLWAKEVFINVLATLYALEWWNEIWLISVLKSDPNFNLASIVSLLIFILLYTPCVSVIWVLKQELWTKWAIIWLVYPTILAWLLAFAAYRILI